MKFIDEATIFVQAGAGGNGCLSFRREKYVPRGGPDGGDGGKGGDVALVASGQLSTLLDFRYQQQYQARRGQHGKGKNKEGRSAPDLVLPVPVGTVIWDADSGQLLKDFTREGERFIAAPGGRGGRGNARFATSTNQAPRRADPGEPGEARRLRLELKLMADIGIVGFPNAGKSTLISRISAVRPKVADYPFTTLVPNLGVVCFGDHPSFVVADIPGIIEGAHRGVGLGLQFLRHVERTRLLLHLLDLSETGRPPLGDYEILNRELKEFSSRLAAKDQVIALNKIDDPAAGERLEETRRSLEGRGLEVFPISALTGQGLPALLSALVRRLGKAGEGERAP
ncbi:MAG: GTPase ObgE [Deltaproteobacteria bacterium]|nr:GTPase ObgE [Deltaproteobacteria bacterium]